MAQIVRRVDISYTVPREGQDELVSDGALTGDGGIAFLATTAGRIVKLTIATGKIERLFPAVPHCDDPQPLVAGSLARLHCTATTGVAELQRRLRIDGVDVPVLYASGGEIGVQIPWGGFSFFGSRLTLEIATDSPFQPAQSVTILEMLPRFEPADRGQSTILGLKLFKADGKEPLTSQPAPGDIVFAHMSGLGAVNGPMQTGVPAPTDVPTPILGTLTCRFSPQSSPAETLFAGLAPGTIGIYQVSFRMPPDAGATPISGASCSWKSVHGGGVMGPLSQP